MRETISCDSLHLMLTSSHYSHACNHKGAWLAHVVLVSHRMQVSTANDIKVYNISTGRSLPEWISDRKKRSLLRNDEGLRRRIELIQDFNMPTASTHVKMTNDAQYIFTAGVYKPRIRCYDTAQLSMKFERCIENEVVAMTILSDDYSKFVLLESNRSLEFHVQHGFYYSTRIPTFGRDLAYHYPSCDLYVAAAGSELYRLNLEQGQFMSPLNTQGRGATVCEFCKEHQLLAVGTEQGKVECFDPRSRGKVNILPVTEDGLSVTALRFNDALTLGVGTECGQVLLYDIRSSQPFAVKEHHYQLPINSLHFHSKKNLVLSSDRKALRIWDKDTCNPFTSIEPDYDINQVCSITDTGLVFMAVEHSQVLSYFIPSLGTAPRWCSFLDNLTEELEELPQTTIYDDYKFVTSKELDDLGLSHLIGTNVLRAYMHGYFMDIRLYHKAKAIAEPFAYQEYRLKKIQQKIEEERASRVQKKTLPKVNRDLALKLMTASENDDLAENRKKHKKRHQETNPLTDERFSALFQNPDYEVDTSSAEYKLLNPLLSQSMKLQEKVLAEEEERDWEEIDNESSSEQGAHEVTKEPVVTLMKGDIEQNMIHQSQVLLGKRLRDETVKQETNIENSASKFGSQQATFSIRKTKGRQKEAAAAASIAHRIERKDIRRSASSIMPRKSRAVYWKGKRVK